MIKWSKKQTPKEKSLSKKANKLRFANESEIKEYSSLDQQGLLQKLGLTSFGLTNDEFEKRLDQYGENQIRKQKFSWGREFLKNYFSPFNIILFLISIWNFIDYGVLSGRSGSALAGAVIVFIMPVISGTVSFVQDIKTYYSTRKISKLVSSTTNVIRHKTTEGMKQYVNIDKENSLGLIKLGEELDVKQLVPGDLLYLSSGDMIPADVRIVYSTDLFINQSSLTGESLPVDKHAEDPANPSNILDLKNICYTGTSVVSGSAIAIVIATGSDTYFATINKAIAEKRPEGSFTHGIKIVTKVLMCFMFVIVPIVYLINGGVGYAEGGHQGAAWLQALWFAIGAAVGLTPEMLPMIVTSNLSNGARRMAQDKVVVKQLDAIQSLGAIDILTTDKTGTLTNDKIKLIDFVTVDKKTDPKLLRDLYINSYFQTGLKNPMDAAIVEYVNENKYNFDAHEDLRKVDEIPFDFNRRRLTIVADIKGDGRLLVTKGSMEEVLSCCTKVYYKGKTVNLTDDIRNIIDAYYEEVNKEGKRIVGVATKEIKNDQKVFEVEDEKDLTFMGFATFLDTPKPSTMKMIKLLKKYGVDLKILTGDNEPVTRAICKMVGLKIKGLVTGDMIEAASEYEIQKMVEDNNIFVKLNPLQKVKVVQILKQNGHTVGYMGDGINDAPVLRQADVAISVNNAVDIAKDASDIILLEKSLLVLEKGIIQGRTIFGNILKYIKITTSSNFGNVLSLIVASAWLPFQPMVEIQLLFQNLIYDCSQFTIALDNVDEKFIGEPQRWRAKEIIPFALWNGPISSLFDITTFLIMGYGMHFLSDFSNAFSGSGVAAQQANIPQLHDLGTQTVNGQLIDFVQRAKDATHIVAMFNAGWFMEGLLTQTMIVQVLRTEKVPFVQSNSAWPVDISTTVDIAIGLIIGFVAPIGHLLQMAPVPDYFLGVLAAILVCYAGISQGWKMVYKKSFHMWL